METPGNGMSRVGIEAGKKDITISEIGAEARLETEIQQKMSFMEALKLYPTAAGWSIFFSLGVVMCKQCSISQCL